MKHYYQAIWPKRILIVSSKYQQRCRIPAEDASFFIAQGWRVQYGRTLATVKLCHDVITCYNKAHDQEWAIPRNLRHEEYLQRYYDAYYKEYRPC